MTFFGCQGHFKDFLENYGFCQKSRSDAYSRGWGGGLVIWHIAYENRYVAHPLYLNAFVTIEKMEPRNYDLNSITIDFYIIFFQKNYLNLTVTKPNSYIRTLRKQLGKHVKQSYNAAFSHL